MGRVKIWLVQDGEPLPGIDAGARAWRCGVLSRVSVEQGHEVLWWASTFDHAQKRHRRTEPETVVVSHDLRIRLLHGPGYATNRSPRRFFHQRVIALAFTKDATHLSTPDIIVCGMPSPELAEAVVAYGQEKGIPVVIDVRDQWPDVYLMMVPRVLRRLARMALNSEFRRIKRVLGLATGIVSVSDTYLAWALDYADRPKGYTDAVFPLGYDTSTVTGPSASATDIRAKFGLRADDLIVTFVGVFGFSYDLETVIHAARVLQRKDDAVKILLIGDGDTGPRIRAMAQGLTNLIVTGWLDDQSIQELLGLSAVGLAAYSEKATQSLPNKSFEYMAAGLPLLSSLSGELEDLILREKIGLSYVAGDVDSLVHQIVWLREHPAERRLMGERVRKLFDQRYRAEVIYPEYVAHLESVANG